MSGRDLPSLELGTLGEWHDWLKENHASSTGVWLLLKRKGVPGRSLTREQAWEEALCFGWIDGLIRKVDEERFAQKFTPRKKGSSWSQVNLKKVEELSSEGRMRDCGMAALEGATAIASARPNKLSPEIEGMVKANRTAWRNFRELPSGERSNFIHWMMEAKRDETRRKRAKEAVRLLAEGKRLGLK